MSEITLFNLEVTSDGKLRSDHGMDKVNHFFGESRVYSPADVLEVIERAIAGRRRLGKSVASFEIKIYPTDGNFGWAEELNGVELGNGTKLVVADVANAMRRGDLTPMVNRYIVVINQIRDLFDGINRDIESWGMNPVNTDGLANAGNSSAKSLIDLRSELQEKMREANFTSASVSEFVPKIQRLSECIDELVPVDDGSDEQELSNHKPRLEQELSDLDCKLRGSISEVGHCLNLDPRAFKTVRMKQLADLGFGPSLAKSIVDEQSPGVVGPPAGNSDPQDRSQRL